MQNLYRDSDSEILIQALSFFKETKVDDSATRPPLALESLQQ